MRLTVIPLVVPLLLAVACGGAGSPLTLDTADAEARRARVAVTLSPQSVTVDAAATTTFTCAVTFATDTACSWSVLEGPAGGSVTSTGTYTAPASAGTYHVVATSVAVTSRSATATVTVNAVQGSPTPVASPGYFHTAGARIVDATGQPVRLTGLSWFGLETSTFAPHGLWARSMGELLDEVKALGYNTLRIPYSNQAFDAGSQPNGIDFTKNPDLVGLDALHVLDKVVAGARARGLRVILDRHRPDASAQSELWYTDAVPESRWISDWTMLAGRYAGDPTVIGVDLHNEPHGAATWGDENLATDWRLAAQRAGNAILAVNPGLLVFVEGVEHVGNDWTWWGGNLSAAGSAPVVLSVPDRVVYSPHDYPSSVYAQSWFSDSSYPANLPAFWGAHWGYLVTQGIAPVWIGEFGTRLQTTSDAQWLDALAGYVGTNGISFAFWCLNPDSGDTGGILQDDWTTVESGKQQVLQRILAPAL